MREARRNRRSASASALRYVNTSLRAQLDEIVRALPSALPPPVPRNHVAGHLHQGTSGLLAIP